MKKKRWKVGRVRQLSRRHIVQQSLLQDKTFLSIIAGIMFGVGLSTLFLVEPLPSIPIRLPYSWRRNDDPSKDEQTRTQKVTANGAAVSSTNSPLRKELYAGVLTAGKFLQTRATACNRTWGQDVSRLEFFSQVKHVTNLPIVALPNVDDDVYPPQQKAFQMLKYMCQHYIDDYNWFLRADDDVYIKVDKLLEFLSQIDHSKKIYIGQPGYGFPEVRHKLGLDGHSFCMGGPGVIFSRAALMDLCPHLDQCMVDVVSREEDVEIGRCVIKHLGIQCTRSWEFLDLFYHAYEQDFHGEKPFTGNLDENPRVKKALTLHYAKEPHIMYRLHRYKTSQQIHETTEAINDLSTAILQMENYLSRPVAMVTDGSQDKKQTSLTTSWTGFTADMRYLVPNSERLSDSLKEYFQKAVKMAVGYISQHHGNHLQFSHFSGGFYRYHQGNQLEFLLDLVFKQENSQSLTTKRVNVIQPVTNTRIKKVTANHNVENSLHLVISSSGDIFDLKSFMCTFEENILKNLHCPQNLTTIFKVDNDPELVKELESVLAPYRQQYRSHRFLLARVNDQSCAWQIYHEVFQQQKIHEHSLVLLADTQTNLSSSLLQHCYGNTIQGKQVYVPVPFVQTHSDQQAGLGETVIIFCVYSSDLNALVNFSDMNTSSCEDSLVERVQKSGLQIFRAYDSDLKIISSNS